jgi:hypothetical protein
MIPNPTAMITILIVATPALILILFLPAIIELKKPKDRGPRMIMAEVPEVTLSLVHSIPIANMEREQTFDSSLIQTMTKIMAVLPSLEV